MAMLKVIRNVGIHSRPIIALEDAFFCFENAVMASEQVAMCFLQNVRNKVGWQKDYNSTRLRGSFHSLPNQSIFDKTAVR